MSDLERRILDVLSEPGVKPLRAAALAKRLNLTKKQLPEFREALQQLLASRRVKEGKKGRLRPRHSAGLVEGIVKRISSGAGYLRPHQPVAEGRPGEIYIAPADMSDAHTGDEVLVRLTSGRHRSGQRCGVVEQVLVRASGHFVGTYLERNGQGYVEVDGNTFRELILVGDPGAKGAQPNDKVVIEMLRFPSHSERGEGVLTQILGPRGAPGVDTLSVIHEFGLRDTFSDEVLDEAREQAEHFDERQLTGRLDLTGETIVTIDPVDARDFDDAISLTRTSNDGWRLGVHIADVSHFVPPKSALDEEARIRGTSVYLPDRVIPMLPEVISNGLASLQQGKVRYTQSVFIEFDAEGMPLDVEFARSAIRVASRFAYEEVLPLIEGTPGGEGRAVPKPVRELLTRMHDLAMLLRARRLANGALDLSLREVKLQLDENGAVTGAREVPHDESHQIIEEFMLAANIAVAGALDHRGIAFIRRGHGEPDSAKLRALAQFAKILGYPLKRCESRRDLQGLLNRVAGRPHERAINFALLRSLKQAEYTVADVGHYALGVDNYCHFTSPIRRYPDLTVHRTVAEVLFDHKSRRGGDVVALAKTARQCSVQERKAEQAERELIKVKLLTFLADKVGLEMDATITGVERFGFFCQGVELPVDGLVHITALDRGDFYEFDEATFSLIARRSGRQYRLGDTLSVKVAHVDVDRRQLDFAIVPERARSKQKKRTDERDPTPKARHPRLKEAQRSRTPEESNAIRARRREKKRSRAERRGQNGRRPGG
jgi:ribonuclease R